LPNLCFTGNRSDCADFLLSECVDDRRLAGIGIANEAYRNLTAVGVESGELAKKRDERALAERVVDGGVESEGRIFFR